ncbi:MAG: hypothetical protein KGH57_01915 [Candidatus Micrarchaeota archaeon]|nr:hypothetical protein [Candidatus Micrarchaeota archaeon]
MIEADFGKNVSIGANNKPVNGTNYTLSTLLVAHEFMVKEGGRDAALIRIRRDGLLELAAVRE